MLPRRSEAVICFLAWLNINKQDSEDLSTCGINTHQATIFCIINFYKLSKHEHDCVGDEGAVKWTQHALIIIQWPRLVACTDPLLSFLFIGVQILKGLDTIGNYSTYLLA